MTGNGFWRKKVCCRFCKERGSGFSGRITSDEKMYYWNTEYLDFVQFFTIDNHEAYSKVEHSLFIGRTYPIQIASRIIGQATLLDFSYT